MWTGQPTTIAKKIKTATLPAVAGSCLLTTSISLVNRPAALGSSSVTEAVEESARRPCEAGGM